MQPTLKKGQTPAGAAIVVGSRTRRRGRRTRGRSGNSSGGARREGSAARQPLHVAAYIRTHPGSVPTVKQHLADLRMLGDWLVVSQCPGGAPGPGASLVRAATRKAIDAAGGPGHDQSGVRRPRGGVPPAESGVRRPRGGCRPLEDKRRMTWKHGLAIGVAIVALLLSGGAVHAQEQAAPVGMLYDYVPIVLLGLMVLGALGGTYLLRLRVVTLSGSLRYMSLLIGVPLCGLLTYEGIMPVMMGGPAIVAVIGFAIGRDIWSSPDLARRSD